jgi:hypothetical protein
MQQLAFHEVRCALPNDDECATSFLQHRMFLFFFPHRFKRKEITFELS